MHLNYSELVHKHHDAHLAYPVKMYLERFDTVEPTRTHVKELYTPRHPSSNVV